MLPSMPIISTPLKGPASSVQQDETVSEKDVELSVTSHDGPTLHKEAPVNGMPESSDNHTDNIEMQKVPLVCASPSSTFAAVTNLLSTTEIPLTVSDTAHVPAETEPIKKSSDQLVEHGAKQKDLQSVEDEKNGESSERKDDEDEMAALMLASTTIQTSSKSRSAKKKPKHIRDIEATLNILAPESEEVKNDKAFGFAQAYFVKITERLEGKDDNLYQEFLKTMNDFGHTISTVVELYNKITALLHEHPDLAEEFLTFLLPEQAMECGKFMEYLMLTKMRDFFRMLEVYFAKQPQQMRKIYSSLCALSNQSNVTLQDVRTTILPLLKGNTLLIDNFLQLLPPEQPPDSIVSDFEEMGCADAGSHHSWDDQFETVEVPDQKDMYGGDQCICDCHKSGDDKYQRRSLHCVSCGTKFIYGRLFVQTGKVLRPAKVVFDDDPNRTIKRLSVKDRPKKCSRKKTSTCFSIGSTRAKAQSEEVGTISPKSSKACKSRVPTPAQKKATCKSSALCKTSPSEEKEMKNASKTATAVSKSCSEPPLKKFAQLCAPDEKENGEEETPSRVSDVTVSLVPTLPSGAIPVGTSLKDFGSLSPKIESNNEFIIDTLEEPENLSCQALQGNNDSEDMNDLSSAADLDMEVDSVSTVEECSGNSSHDKSPSVCWTREEDKIILQMFQMECNAEQTFVKIGEHLSQRSVSEIRDRFYILMNLLEKMTGMKMEQDITK